MPTDRPDCLPPPRGEWEKNNTYIETLEEEMMQDNLKSKSTKDFHLFFNTFVHFLINASNF